MERSEVYKAIDSERAYQQAEGKPDERSIEDWLDSIRYYGMRADDELYFGGETVDNVQKAMHHLRKVAALAVAALEQYGCEPRN